MNEVKLVYAGNNSWEATVSIEGVAVSARGPSPDAALGQLGGAVASHEAAQQPQNTGGPIVGAS